MPALKEFANLITLNTADLAAIYARLLSETDTAYETHSLESRIASGRKLLRAVSQACQQQTSEPLGQIFLDLTQERRQLTSPLTQIECLGNTLTPVAPNLDAGKFLWQILSTVRLQLLKTQNEEGQTVAYLDLSRDITDRHDSSAKLRQAEQSLRDSEERFRRLSDASFEAIAISENGQILDVNEEFTRLYGYSRDEAIGLHALQVVPEEWQELIRQKIMSGDEAPYNAVNRRKDGTTFPAQIVGKMIPYQGRMVRVTAIRDITDQKTTELQLRQRQRELQIILDSVPAAIWFKDAENRILRVNQWAAELMGLSVGEIEGQSVYDLNPAEAEAYYQDDLEVINSGQPKVGIIETIVTATGEVRWLQTDKIPYKNDAGEIAGVIVFALDITERKQAEETLQVTQFALDRVGLDVVWAGSEAQFMYVNDAACRNLGYSRQELLAMTIYDINPALTPEMWAAHWEELTQRKSFTFDTYHRRKNGEMYPVDISVNYVEFEGQAYNCAVWRDITEQVRAEQQIKESLERRTQQIEISTEIAQEIATLPELATLFQRVVDLVQEKFGYYHVHLYTVERPANAANRLIVREGSGDVGQKLKAEGHAISLSAEKSLVASAARSGEAVLAVDVTQEEGWLPNPLLPDTKSELAVPIKLRDEVLGVLDVQSDTLAGLGQEDQLLLMGLCGQIAVAIDTRRAEEERAKVQATLLETEERMRELVNDLPVGIYRNTPGKDGHFLEANPAIVTLFEAGSTAEFMTHNVSDLYRNPEDRQRFSEKMLQQGYLRGEELALKTLKGREIWGAITAVMKTDINGQVYFDGMIEDITERRQVQDDLKKALAEAQILQQLAQTLAGALEIEQVANAFFAASRRLLDVDYAIFSLVDEQQQRIAAVAGFNVAADYLRRANHALASDTIMAKIIRSGQTEIIRGVDAHDVPQTVTSEGVESRALGILTPITIRQQHIGLVEVGFRKQIEEPVQEHHLRLLRTLLDQVAVSIDNVLRYQASRKVARREQTIREITDKMRAASNMEDLARTTAEELGRRFSAKYSLVDFGIHNTAISAANDDPAFGQKNK